MVRIRVFLSCAAVATALATLGLRAQVAERNGFQLLEGVGLPAVDQGVLGDDTHTPGSFEARRRAAVHSVMHTDGVSSSGAAYDRGHVVVRFRDEADPASRGRAVAWATRSGTIAARPSSANFDIVTIDVNEDAEAVARALATRGEVQYAQPDYRVHTLMVPNDPLYAQQWHYKNGPGGINVEPAWRR